MVEAVALNRAKIEGTAISGAGGTVDMEVPAARKATLTVQVDMTGAVNGDLGVVVTPYEIDQATLSAVPLNAVTSSGPTFVTSRVCFQAQYDVSGFDKVRIRITNNNAGAQTVTRASWILTGEDD